MDRGPVADTAAELAPRIEAAAARRRRELVDRLRVLTSLDAPSADAEALAATADLLGAWLAGLGARVARHPTHAGPLLEAEFGPPADAGDVALVLCHYDTVWPIGTAAERPFRAEAGLAHGPGVLDMRGGLVGTLVAIDLLRELEALKRPVRILLTPDEESGSADSRPLIAERAREAAVVLVPEPALPGGALKTSRKGWIVYRLLVRGRAAHAGLEPERGVSAIDEIVDWLLDLRAVADPDACTTVSCGQLRGGSAANVVPDWAEAQVDVRFIDAVEESRVRAAFTQREPLRPGAGVEVEEVHSRPPFPRSSETAAAAVRARSLAALLGLALGEGSAGGVSDGNLAAAQGVAVLDGLGPEGAGAHARDERVEIDSLVSRTALLALLVAEL